MREAYYNENDPFAAQWLRNLISAGHIAPGHVDERSITDVTSADLKGFTQCHFFAGIGVWSHALRGAGWPDDRPVWTGSCPCQPFSGAGKRGGVADHRHLWPVWFDLIRERRPGVILGEQVASRDGLGWWDIVSGDLEGEDYAVGAADLCAPGVGGPHIRQRLYWLADAMRTGRPQGRTGTGDGPLAGCGAARGLGDAASERHGTHDMEPVTGWRECATGSADGACAGGMADTHRKHQQSADDAARSGNAGGIVENSRTGPLNGFWRDADWLFCTDGKWRPVEPGSFPLAHGVAGRVGRLRAYGNAICAPQAVEFIKAVMGG